MPRIPIAAGLLALLHALVAGSVQAAPPRVIRLVPPQGERTVAVGLDTLEMHFDVPMASSITINSADMPTITGAPSWSADHRVLRVPVRLERAHAYRLALNSSSDHGFTSRAGEPLAPVVWAFRTEGEAPPDDFDAPGLGARLAATRVQSSFAAGRLRVTRLDVLEARILLEMRGRPDSLVVERLVREVYAPHAGFWRGYVGDEASFREWAMGELVGESHPIRHRIADVLALPLDSLFAAADAWLARTTGRHPQGQWTIVFGTGATNMGGIGAAGMLVDFTFQPPDARAVAELLPHELTHQVHGRRPHDPDGDTVLGRIVSEGLACYAAWVHGGGARSVADCLGYDDTTYAAALAHESVLADSARALLGSRRREDDLRVASRSQSLIEGGPEAAGYFLGFRLVQAYVARRGPGSWTEVLRLPVRTVVERARYRDWAGAVRAG